jgi:hypothetical protein
VTRRVVFRPQAEDDALAVRTWYEARRDGLGREFGGAVDALVMRIADNHGRSNQRTVKLGARCRRNFRTRSTSGSKVTRSWSWRSMAGNIPHTGEPGRDTSGVLVRRSTGYEVQQRMHQTAVRTRRSRLSGRSLGRTDSRLLAQQAGYVTASGAKSIQRAQEQIGGHRLVRGFHFGDA